MDTSCQSAPSTATVVEVRTYAQFLVECAQARSALWVNIPRDIDPRELILIVYQVDEPRLTPISANEQTKHSLFLNGTVAGLPVCLGVLR